MKNNKKNYEVSEDTKNLHFYYVYTEMKEVVEYILQHTKWFQIVKLYNMKAWKKSILKSSYEFSFLPSTVIYACYTFIKDVQKYVKKDNIFEEVIERLFKLQERIISDSEYIKSVNEVINYLQEIKKYIDFAYEKVIDNSRIINLNEKELLDSWIEDKIKCAKGQLNPVDFKYSEIYKFYFYCTFIEKNGSASSFADHGITKVIRAIQNGYDENGDIGNEIFIFCDVSEYMKVTAYYMIKEDQIKLYCSRREDCNEYDVYYITAAKDSKIPRDIRKQFRSIQEHVKCTLYTIKF